MENKSVISRLDRIEKTLKFIQENMVNTDSILTKEEKKLFDESIKNEKEGELISSEGLRKKLGI